MYLAYGGKEATVPIVEEDFEFSSLDGLCLRGTLTAPQTAQGVAVLTHGGGVTRDEGGFFTRLSAALSRAGIAALRFDMRGHGASEGRQEDLTLASVANDIRAATGALLGRFPNVDRAHLVGASFGGGITAIAAGRAPELVSSIVLFNPLLDYKARFIDQKPYWRDNRIAAAEATDLTRDGFLPHSPTFKLGRPLLNEVFQVCPAEYLARVVQPTLIVHGTGDTFIPVDSSRTHLRRIAAPVKRLLEIEGAQHGIAVHDDPQYAHPQTQAWQREAIGAVTAWMAEHGEGTADAKPQP
ncbi:lysophospholipase [Streptomyces sp. PTM05]|uniref:Lysophospholipase n=2 Tax=Streptantibioticus parmotrematis TaxID=2873249 RepID=A0ABS7QWU7_9ACTN|nr:lysophospholipase [Streptantibioticus parmotrematis]